MRLSVTRVRGRLVQLLLVHKISEHPFVAALAHSQREFFAVEVNNHSAPTALNRSILLRDNFVIGERIFYLDNVIAVSPWKISLGRTLAFLLNKDQPY